MLTPTMYPSEIQSRSPLPCANNVTVAKNAQTVNHTRVPLPPHFVLVSLTKHDTFVYKPSDMKENLMKTLARTLTVAGVTGLLILTPAHAYAQGDTPLWEMEEIPLDVSETVVEKRPQKPCNILGDKVKNGAKKNKQGCDSGERPNSIPLGVGFIVFPLIALVLSLVLRPRN